MNKVIATGNDHTNDEAFKAVEDTFSKTTTKLYSQNDVIIFNWQNNKDNKKCRPPQLCMAAIMY